jgi:hypothetical protein
VGDEKCIQIFGMKPQEKGPLQSPRLRLENNIKMDLNEIGYDNMG